MPLTQTRPLVFFDLETTGTYVANDRIVEISLVKLFPDGKEEVNTFRINPGIPIPAEATIVHYFKTKKVDAYLNVNNHYEGSAPLTIKKFQ